MLGVTLVQLVLLAGLFWKAMQMTTAAYENELLNRAYTLVALFAGMNENAMQSGDMDGMSHNAGVALSNQGVVYARIRQAGQVLAQQGGPEALVRPFAEDSSYRGVGDGVFDTSAEVRVMGKTYGTVEMGFSTSKIDATLKDVRNRLLSIASAVVVLVGLFSFLLATYVTRGLRKMEAAAGELEAGHLGFQVAVGGNDELAKTARAFNRMSEQLDLLDNARERATRDLQQFKSVLDNTLDMIFMFEQRELRFVYLNKGAVQSLGYTRDELLRMSPYHIKPLLPEPKFQELIQPLLDGKESAITFETVHRRKDGREFPVEVYLQYVKTSGGQGFFLAIVHDITERKGAELALQKSFDELKQTNAKLEQAQNQLMQSEKMASVGQLAAGVAHEINNPIGYVYSNLSSLEKYLNEIFGLLATYEQAEVSIADAAVADRVRQEKKKADLEFLREDVGSLMRESKEGITRVKKIVQDLKDFSHVDQDEEWKMEDLHKGLDTTLNIVHNDLKYKARIVKEYSDIPEIECIMSQLNQVFMNMLVNAGHAIEDQGEEQGTITLRTGCHGGEVWVSISDTGKGIAPENLKRIFDPFFTTKPVGKGTGLGLSLSYGIAQKHHGRIEVESAVGKGTTFKVILPIRQPEAAAA